MNRIPAWSPDGIRLVMSVPQIDKRQLAILNVVSGEVARFPDSLGLAMRWLSNDELIVARLHGLTRGKTTILLLHLNVSTGQRTLLKEYQVSEPIQAWSLPGANYALLTPYGSQEGSTQPAKTSVLNLTTGRSLDLPHFDRAAVWSTRDYDWNDASRRLVYMALPEQGSPNRRMVVADADQGIVASKDFPRGTKFVGLRMSPDGRFVFFHRCVTQGVLGIGFAHAQIWDTVSGEITTIRVLGIAESLSGPLFAEGVRASLELPQWSPDGRYVAYRNSYIATDRRFRMVYAVEAADWGSWIARCK
jgi:hypothetical protein